MVSEEDHLRASFYLLLARLLAVAPTAETLRQLQDAAGDETDIGQAMIALREAAGRLSPEQAEDEYNALFIGVARGELVPFTSYYLTGFLNEKPLAELREDMAVLGIAGDDDVPEPEDHIATICEMMAGLITGAFGESAELATQRRFFDAHLASWAPQFFADLEAAGSADLYRSVGMIGRHFMAVEGQAFEMAA
jgi:TorA maturation chaperone TorD